MEQHIRESNLIEGYDDLEFDKQSMVAWNYLKDQDKLTKGVICKVQKLITLKQTDLQPDWRGYYRKIDVWVGGHKGVAPANIDLRVKWLTKHMHQFTPKNAHVEFEIIHPFVDGNGRTGRMLMWWHEIMLEKPPTLILNSQKRDYYKWFEEAVL